MIKKIIAAGLIGGLALVAIPAVANWSDAVKDNKDNGAAVTQSAEQQQGLRISTKEISQHSKELTVDMKIPVISGLKNTALQEKLNKEILGAANKLNSQLGKEAKEYAQEVKKQGFELRPYQLEVGYEVLSTKDILSFAVTTYQYTGGANGMVDVAYYNVDTKQGKVLTLKDLFKEGTDYKKIINEEINKQIAQRTEQGETFFKDEFGGFKSIADDQSFFVEDGNLAIAFGMYDIAPRSEGLPVFYLNSSKLVEHLNDDIATKLNITGYDLVKKEVYKEGVHVKYPQLENIEGELLQNYINQDLEKALQPFLAEAKADTNLNVDYQVTYRSKDKLSVVFRGDQNYEGGKHEILVGKTFDLATGNQIAAANVIKDTPEAQKEVNKLLLAAAKNVKEIKNFPGFGEWMGIYFTDEALVFYYQQSDHETTYVELAVPLEKIKLYLNTYFGSNPKN